MEIFSRINWVDVIVIIIMLRTSYVALQDGLSHEIFPLIASIFTVITGLHYYDKIAYLISRNVVGLPAEVLKPISFILLVLVVWFILKLIRSILDKIIKVSWHPLIEKFGGLICGIIKASIVTSIILIILALIPLPYLQTSIREKSLTGMYFLKIGPTIYEKVTGLLPIVRTEAERAGKANLIRDLASDKMIAQETKKQNKKQADWEKGR